LVTAVAAVAAEVGASVISTSAMVTVVGLSGYRNGRDVVVSKPAANSRNEAAVRSRELRDGPALSPGAKGSSGGARLLGSAGQCPLIDPRPGHSHQIRTRLVAAL
jgi:hypothetical protein